MKTILTAVFSLFVVTAFSQQNFLPGHIVTESGDTLFGLIDYRNWETNPTSIRMKGSSEQLTTYTINEIRTFTVDKHDRYEKAIVKRTTRPITPEALQLPYTDTVLTDTVLLRTILLGKNSLYQLEKGRNYYYFKDSTGNIDELLYRVVMAENNLDYNTYYAFRNQLKQKLGISEDDALFGRLENLRYTEKDITKLIRVFQPEAPTDMRNGWQPDRKKLLSFYVGTGARFSRLRITGADHMLTRMDYGGYSVSPVFQAGMDVYASRNRQRLFFRGELGYSSMSFNGKSYSKALGNVTREHKYELKMQNVGISADLMYSFVKTKSVDVFAGLGYLFHITQYKTHRLTTTYSDGRQPDVEDPYHFDYEKGWGVVNGKIGARFLSRLEANVHYVFSGTFSTLLGLEIDPNIVGLQVNYRL